MEELSLSNIKMCLKIRVIEKKCIVAREINISINGTRLVVF